MRSNPWDIVASLGQVAGALATFLAVWVALHQNRIKLKFVHFQSITQSRISNIEGYESSYYNECTVRVTNIGTIPVTIQSIGLLTPKKKKKLLDGSKVLPKLINPGESVQCSIGIKSTKERFKYGSYCIDNGLRYYFDSLNIFHRIKEFFWWRFGKEIKEIND